jgi:hypothetical protein
MANLYVDFDDGNDGNVGDLEHPVKTIPGAVSKITAPFSGEKIILLKNDLVHYTDNIEINGISCFGAEAKLVIQPLDFDYSKYIAATQDPFGGTGGWGIDGVKPVKINAKITVKNSNEVEFRGICFGSGNDNAGCEALNQGLVSYRYCRFEGEKSGVTAFLDSKARIENCYFIENKLSVNCSGKSMVVFAGENYIKDAAWRGVMVTVDSTVWFFPWTERPRSKYITTIETLAATIGKYAAIDASVRSVIFVQTQIPPELIGDGTVALAKVKILNSLHENLPPDYFGVILDSGSILTGFSNMTFKTPNDKGDSVDMPEDQKVVGKLEEGTLITD